MGLHIVVDARIRRSGTGRYTDRLLKHLQLIDRENRYTVLLQPDDPWRPSAANFQVQACRYAQFSFNPFDQLTFSWQLYRLKPDLVHFTMTQQPILYFGNIVTTTHDLTMLHYTRPGRLPQWLHAIRMQGYRLLFWLAHRKSKCIIVPSNYVKEALIKLQPFTKSKTAVTYEASEPPLRIAAKQLKNVTKSFIFHVGSPFPHKNIERLVKAFEILHNLHPDLQLVLAGKKEFYFTQLIALVAKSSAKNQIYLPGFVGDAELKWLYENAAAYVLPSLSEGFGLPGLEAMAHGCPVASSNAPCLPEIYKDGAAYFDPLDPSSIAETVDAILTDPKFADSLRAKGKVVAGQYSWQHMAEQTLAVYKEALGES